MSSSIQIVCETCKIEFETGRLVPVSGKKRCETSDVEWLEWFHALTEGKHKGHQLQIISDDYTSVDEDGHLHVCHEYEEPEILIHCFSRYGRENLG